MGDKFLAVFRVYDRVGTIIDFVQANSEFAAIMAVVKRGKHAASAEVHRIINL